MSRRLILAATWLGAACTSGSDITVTEQGFMPVESSVASATPSASGAENDSVTESESGAPRDAPSQQAEATSQAESAFGGVPTSAAAAAAASASAFLARCGPGVLTALGAERIGRRPYLQNVTASSAVVAFTTRELGLSPRLMLTGAFTRPRSIATDADPADATGHQRVASLTGLEPGTAYCYQLEDWTEPVAFRTPPRAGTEAPVRFIAFGDSGGDSRELVAEQFDRVEYDLILHMGDIGYPTGTLANLETKFFDTYASVLGSTPVFPASGNHEYLANEAAAYRQVFALPENGGPDGIERWYSYDWGDVHFVALDTERVGEAQKQWLEQDLAHNELRWTIVYMHRPPFSSGTHGGNATVRDTFAPIFEKYTVPLVLSGHDHDYERTEPINGVTYVVTGAGGYGLRPVSSSDFTAKSESVLHFVHVGIEGDELVLRAIDTTGVVFDEVRVLR